MINSIIDKLIECGNINAEEKELYSYGLQQAVMMTVNLLTIIIIALLMGMFWQSIIFMLSYLPLRAFAGGYHAKTQLRCYLLSGLLNFAVLLVLKFIIWPNFISIGLGVIAAVVIFFLSPVEDRNKPLDDLEMTIYKKRTKGLLVIELCVLFLLIGIGLNQIPRCIALSLLVLSSMLVLGKCKNKKIAFANEKEYEIR